MPTVSSEEPFDCARAGEPIFLALGGLRGARVDCGAEGPSMDPRTIGPVAAEAGWATTRR